MGTYEGPGALQALKEPLIESVINAYMMKEAPSGEMEFEHGGCDEGEFRYIDRRFGQDNKIYCYYPSGQWKHERGWEPDPELGVDESNGDLTTFDAAAAFAEIRTMISSWIDPWIACQDPSAWSGEIQQLADVVAQLYVFDEVRLDTPYGGAGGGDGESAGGSDQRAVTPVADVRAAILGMENQLSSLQGLAIDALEDAYVSDVGFTISGQRVLAAIATIAVSGEAEAWYRAYQAVGEFFENATKDFNSWAGTKDAEPGADTALSIVSGVTGLASLGTAAFPPASIALGAISGITGIAGNFYGGSEATTAVQLRLKGGDYQAKLQSFMEQVLDVHSELQDAEYALGEMCLAGLDTYYSQPDGFSITSKGRPSRAPGPVPPYLGPRGMQPAPTDPQPGDDLPRFMDADEGSPGRELYNTDAVHVVHGKLRTVAGQIERVSDHQREVANQLDAVAVANQWSRSSLQGRPIGWGSSGHRTHYKRIVDELGDLLVKESRTAHSIAEHCYDIATDFSQTDAEIETGLDRVEAGLP